MSPTPSLWSPSMFATPNTAGIVKPDFSSITMSNGVIAAPNAGSTPSFADAETPAGVVNGVNKVFTLAHAPSPAASLQLYLGLIQQAGADCTLAGAVITFAVAPAVGSTPIAWYRY